MDLQGSLVDTNLRIYPNNNLINYLKSLPINGNVPENIVKLVRGKDYEFEKKEGQDDTETIQVYLDSRDIENLNKIKLTVKVEELEIEDIDTISKEETVEDDATCNNSKTNSDDSKKDSGESKKDSGESKKDSDNATSKAQDDSKTIKKSKEVCKAQDDDDNPTSKAQDDSKKIKKSKEVCKAQDDDDNATSKAQDDSKKIKKSKEVCKAQDDDDNATSKAQDDSKKIKKSKEVCKAQDDDDNATSKAQDDSKKIKKSKEVCKAQDDDDNATSKAQDDSKKIKKSKEVCNEKTNTEHSKKEDKLHLTTSDIDWLYTHLQKLRKKGEKDVPYLHTLLEGTDIGIPENKVIKRNPILEARCVKLRAQQEAREYRKMTKSVDNVRMRFPEDSISYQLKQVNRQLIAIGQFIISIFAGFLFGFKGLEWMIGNLDFGFRLLMGVMCALIIALAEIYFLAKKLNEELNVPETIQLGGPPKFADTQKYEQPVKTRAIDKEHQD